MKALILEDEQIIARELCDAITELNAGITILGVVPGIKAARKWFDQNPQPDLLFMDIQLSDGVGFELFDHVSITCPVIFTTAYDEYTLKAIKHSALDYLLKPVDKAELAKAIAKAKKQYDKNNAAEKIDQLLAALNLKTTTHQVALPTMEGLLMINTDDILYCESDSAYTYFVFTDGKKILSAKTLKEVEEVLTAKNFYRVHNSFLINLRYIKKYIKGAGGEVVMVNDKHIPISRTKKQEFLGMLEKI